MDPTLNCQYSEKNIGVKGQIFLKLLTPKYMLISMHNRDCFWKPFGSESVNESQKILLSAEKYFSPTFSLFWAKLSLKNLFLIRSEILGLLVSSLTLNLEYSRSNRENLPIQIQINWSENAILFGCIFLLIF